MSIRTRITILGGLCIWLGVVGTYVVLGQIWGFQLNWERHEAQSVQMNRRAEVIEWAIDKAKSDPAALPGEFPADLPPGGVSYGRLVLADGTILAPPGQPAEIFQSPSFHNHPYLSEPGEPGADLDPAVQVARSQDGRDVEYATSGEDASGAFRVLIRQIQPGVALQLAQPYDAEAWSAYEEEELAGVILFGGLCGFAAAFLIAWIATMPIRRLSREAEKVAELKQVSEGITREGTGDMRKLTRSFNRVIEALRDSLRLQRQLVTDASHELRTPLTSLRTNIEVLLRVETLAPEDQKKLLRDVVEQIDELTFLISDLTDLARVGDSAPEAVDVRLDRIVERTVRRMERNWPKVNFEISSEPTSVRGVASKIERAVSNILDNAAKWSPEGRAIEVSVAAGELRVRDHGPGIPDADLPHIFERFYRADDTRGQPGSGIGLAIVQQVAESHGGSVAANNAQDGGAIVRMTLPESQMESV